MAAANSVRVRRKSRLRGVCVIAALAAAAAALLYAQLASATPTISAGSATATADDANAGTFVTVSDIVISEAAGSDFGGDSSGTWPETKVVMEASSGWQFDEAQSLTPTVVGGNIDGASVSVESGGGSLTLTLNGSGNDSLDSVTISGLHVRPTQTTPLKSGGVACASASNIGLSCPGRIEVATLTETAGVASALEISWVPWTAGAGSAFAVMVESTDAYGNTQNVTQDTAFELSASGTGTLSGNTGAISAGAHSVELTSVRYTKAETITLTASRTSGDELATSDPSSSISVYGATPTKLVFTSDTTSVASGAQKTLSIAVEDQYDNVVTGYGGLVLLSPGGSGTVSGLGWVTISAGIATTTVTGATAGSVTVLASASGLSSASTSFTVTPGPASKLVFSSSTNPIASGFTKGLTALVEDANGNVVTSDSATSVTFAQTDGTGSVSGLGSVTASFGVAAKTVTGVTAGSVTIGATADGLASASTTFTVMFGTATKVVFTSSTDAVASGSTKTLTAAVEDANGNIVTNSTKQIVFAKTSGTGSVTGLGGVTASSGIATKTVTGVAAGSVTVRAADFNGTLTSDSTTFSVTPGSATKLVFTSSSADLTSGSTRTLTAAVEDANGNVVTSDSTTEVTFANSSGTGTVDGLGTATAVNGVASLTVTGHTAGSITIAASATGLTGDSTTFTVTTGPLAKLFVGAVDYSPVAGSPVEVDAFGFDANDNFLEGYLEVVWSSTGGGSFNTTVSGDVGYATAYFTTSAAAGTQHTVTATAVGTSATGTSAPITTVPGPAAQLHFTSSGDDLPSGATRDLTVEVQDANGNVVTSDSSTQVTLAQSGGTGSMTGLGAVSADHGVATDTVTGDVAGAVNVDASASGLTGDSTSFTVVAAADTSAPDTSLTSMPSSPTKSTSASFSFKTTESASFECSLDGGGFSTCTSPQDYPGPLAQGSHTFEVRAKDLAGNIDSTPASHTWRVDTTPPQTSISARPSSPSSSKSASFSFSASETGSTFACKLDGGSYQRCTNPKSYLGLPEGLHSFAVAATDQAGNADATPATFSWRVDSVAPVTTAPVSSLVQGSVMSATVPVLESWSGSDPSPASGLASYTLQRQAGLNAFATLALPTPLTQKLSVPFGVGTTYRLRTRATDKAGNVGVFVTGPSVRVERPQENAGSIVYTGGWTGVSNSNASGGAYKESAAAGATATLSFSGARSIALVPVTGPDRGKATVLMDGSTSATLDLYSASPAYRALFYVRSTTTGSHTLQIKVLGQKNASSAGTKVGLDTFVLLKY